MSSSPTDTLTAASKPRNGLVSRLGTITFSRELGLLVLAAILIVIFSLAYPRTFPTAANFAAILRNLAAEGTVVIGMTIMLVSGLFDLSVGSMFSMVGVVTAWMLTSPDLPVPAAIVLGLGVALLGGFINGFIVARIKVNALITTLGTLGIYRGIALLVGGPGIQNLPPAFNAIGQSTFLGLQFGVWLMLALVIVFSLLMSRSRFFRQYYYIGGNEKAALLSGMNVPRLQIIAFMISGLLAGLAGMVFASRVGSAVSIAGDGLELRIITAAVLGGASLKGGQGTIIGGLIGVVFIALVRNVIIIAGISGTWDSIIIGIVLVSAVALDSFINRVRAA